MKKLVPAGRKWFFVLALPLGFCLQGASQDVITINGEPCGLHGNPKNSRIYVLNGYKNRYAIPQDAEINRKITFSALAKSADPNQFSPADAVVIRGYVTDVKVGGIETCNCKAKDPQFRDTHIELSPTVANTGVKSRLIVEVTPRLRMAMKEKGVDWSTETLRRTIKGKRIEVKGWLTYDSEHETGAFANDPGDAVGEKNWRASCWEVHPITSLKIVGAPAKTEAEPPLPAEPAPQPAPVPTTRNKEMTPSVNTTPEASPRVLVILLLIVVGLVVVLLLRQRK